MAYVKITHDLDRRMEEYSLLLDRVADVLKEGAKQTVIGSAIRFARTAARYTPPAVGREKIPADLCKRSRFRDLEDPATWDRYGRMHFARVERFGHKTPYGIKGRGKWEWFADRESLERRKTIWGRGSARYGWLQALPVLGEDAPAIVPAKLSGMAGKLSAQGANGYTRVSESDVRIEIEIENTTAAVDGNFPLEYAAARALSLVNHGLKQQLKRLEKDLEEVPF